MTQPCLRKTASKMNTKHHKTREWNLLEANHYAMKVSGYFFSKQIAKNEAKKILRAMALKFRVKIYSCAVNGNYN